MKTAADVKRVLVLGTGTMGQGIAQIAAAAGTETRLYDVDPVRTRAAIAGIEAFTEKSVQKGKLPPLARKDLLRRLRPIEELSVAIKDMDLCIEAIPESMDLKVGVLGKIVAACPPEAIIASNTSSLSITEIGARIGAAERTVGMHFFNPVPLMELVEVVRGVRTSEETVRLAVDVGKRFEKTCIVVNDVPGFATSRLGVAIGAEAIRMLESGVASVEDIDRAMELGYRHPMGPLKLGDLVGLDVRLAILEHLHREVGEQFRPPALLRQMVRAGKLGKKSGEGFYEWTPDGPVPTRVR
jgi:3-hydroxybutyryl-CoA dehydrogenase